MYLSVLDIGKKNTTKNFKMYILRQEVSNIELEKKYYFRKRPN